METEEITILPVEEAPPVEAPPLPPKFRREIQPKDDEGNPIGQAHVYEADTEEELFAKMDAAIANGTKKIRELTRQAEPVLPEGAIPEEEAPVWKPRALTDEEKFVIKTDPEKAFEIQFAAKYGMTPEEKRKADEEQYAHARVTREQAETSMFTDDHPEYYGCEANRNAIVDFIKKHKLAWRAKNLDIAYRELSGKGLLQQKPVAAPVAPAPARTEPTQQGPTFPSTIRNRTTSATGPVVIKKEPSAEEVGRIDSEALRKKFPELRNAR